MRTHILAAAAFVAASLLCTLPAAAADTPSVVRKVLDQHDAPGGQTLSLVSVTIPPGGREGRHTHPGLLMVQVLSGEMTMTYEGKPTALFKAGDSFTIEPGQIHEGINRGTEPMVAVAAFLTPKGAPLTTPVK